MAKMILIDEFHVTISAPSGLPTREHIAIRRTLDDAKFQEQVRRALRVVIRRWKALARIRVKLSR